MNAIQAYNKTYVGILIGLVVPFTSYGLLLYLYDMMDAAGIFNPVGLTSGFRERTIALIALVCNVIPMQLFNRRHYLDAMRGIVFPTLAYVALWMYYYGFDLLK